jgi:Pregnancy-associated plasma protein-A
MKQKTEKPRKYKTAPPPPARRKCGTMAVHSRLLEQDPSFGRRLVDLERLTSRRMLAGLTHRAAGPTVISVVVHVVYDSASENISDAQIRSQIKRLNADYRAKNPDRKKTPSIWRGLVTDARIQFALATKGPDGKPTKGITRTKTTKTSFTDDDGVKSVAKGGADPWPSKDYLNLWVCSLGGGLLGYAQFPGGPAKTDGVVILNTAFGTRGTATAPFNLGRTATHEVGHWLNLHHIWGDTQHCEGTDFINDTPNARLPNYGKPKFPHISCSNGPNGDMFMNYMDYVDDDSMLMFTAQQTARMNAALAGPRSGVGK